MLRFIAALGALVISLAANIQFPSQPIDILATPSLGQSLVVDHKPATKVAMVARSKPTAG
jgi:hypothetical protein